MSSLGLHLPACPPSIAQTCKTRSTGHRGTPVRVTPGGSVLPLGQPHGGGILSPWPVVAAAAPRAEPAPGKSSSVFGGRMSLSQPLSRGQCGALRLSPEAPTPPPPGSRPPLLPPTPSSWLPQPALGGQRLLGHQATLQAQRTPRAMQRHLSAAHQVQVGTFQRVLKACCKNLSPHPPPQVPFVF